MGQLQLGILAITPDGCVGPETWPDLLRVVMLETGSVLDRALMCEQSRLSLCASDACPLRRGGPWAAKPLPVPHSPEADDKLGWSPDVGGPAQLLSLIRVQAFASQQYSIQLRELAILVR